MNDLINIAKKCIGCKNAPCKISCPIHNDLPMILKFYKEEKYNDAYQLLFNNNPLFMLCGITCDHYNGCAKNCNYIKIKKERIEIEKIEADLFQRFGCHFNFPKINKGKILIVGAGPSGLISAINFRKNGYDVSVIDKNDHIGGVIYSLIPSFRFDLNILFSLEEELKKDIKFIFKTSFEELDKAKLSKFKHIIMAAGTPKAIKQLHQDDVFDGLELLEKIKNGPLVLSNKKIAVLGLGNVAIDCARSLKRMGNDVQIIYRRDLSNCKASLEELEMLKVDEIPIQTLLSCVVFDKKIATFEKMKLGELDASGRKSFIKTGEFIECEFDYLVEAYGSKPNMPYIDEDFMDYLDHGYPIVNNFKNYYFVGDLYTGSSTIVSSIKNGLDLTKKIIQNDEIMEKINQYNKPIFYGGSFNPITKAHKQIYYYLKSYALQDVIIVPNGDQYQIKDLIPFDERLKMINLDLNKPIINEDLKDQIFNGTIELLRKYNHPLFVIGSDSLKTLNKWINYEDLVKENIFICFKRANDNIDEIIQNDEFLNKYRDHFLIIDLDILNISSTDFREKQIENVVSKKVFDLISKCKYY